MDIGAPNLISLPSYPFSTQKFWVPYVGDNRGRLEAPQSTNFSFLQNWTEFPSGKNGGVATFQTAIGQLKRYIEGHKVGGVPLCPASVYLEFILAAVSLTTNHLECKNDHSNIVLRRISFSKPLTWNFMDKDGADLVTATVDAAKRSFTLKSRGGGSDAEALHASGEYHLDPVSKTRDNFTQLLPRIIRSIDHILKPGNQTPETFSTRTLYEVIFPRVVEYSKEFHTIGSLAMTSDGMEATGTIRLASDCDAAKFVVHPLFLDSLMHVAGFVSNLRGGLNDAYICNQIGSVQTLPDLIQKEVSYLVYCKITPLPDRTGLLAESYAILDAHPRALVAYVKDIRFQHVRLTGLKATLTSVSGIFPTTPSDRTNKEPPFSPYSPPNIVDGVIKVITEACSADPKDISIDLEVERLGIDSLMLLKLSYDLSKIFPGFGYPSRELSKCRTIRDVVDAVATFVSGGSPHEHSVYPFSPAASSSMVSTPRTMVHTPGGSPCVKKIFAHILEVDEEDIQEDTRLSLLGLDSLSSIEAIHTLRHEYGVNVPGDLLSSPQATIRDINSQISGLETSPFPFGFQRRSPKQGLGDSFNRMNNALYQKKSISLLQNSSSNRTPLVLIHDGSGLTVSYERLAGLDRRVWGIANPRFASSEPWGGLLQMAKTYSSLIFDEIDGPVILGGPRFYVFIAAIIADQRILGWSFGGIVAFEIARILQLRSTIVKGLVLIDSPSPSLHVPLSSALIDHVLSSSSANLNLELQKLCRIQFIQNSQLLADYSATEIQKQPSLPLVFLKSSEPYNVSIDIEISSWLSNHADAMASIQVWESMSGGLVEMLDIPGNHFEAFSPQNVGPFH
jgi:iterative type I PKS product template protein